MNEPASREPTREAFATRLRAVVEMLAASAAPATIERSLAMADPLSALTVVLADATTSEAALGDPLTPARVRGIGARARLIERAGGVLRLPAAAERLGISPQAVARRRSRGTILAVPMPDGEWVYPAFQFTRQGILPGLAEVLRAFHDDSGWTKLSVLRLPAPPSAAAARWSCCGRVTGRRPSTSLAPTACISERAHPDWRGAATTAGARRTDALPIRGTGARSPAVAAPARRTTTSGLDLPCFG